MQFTEQCHRLHVILGPMKAEKSSEAIRIANKYKRYYKVIYVDSKINTRNKVFDKQGRQGLVKSRSGMEIDCIIVQFLHELEQDPKFKEAHLVVIDEAQFFDDLYDHVTKWCNQKSYIVVSLDGDYKQQLFGQACNLIPIADEITKLTAFCEICCDGTPAVCTIRTTDDESTVVDVDSAEGDKYMVVCRKHRNK